MHSERIASTCTRRPDSAHRAGWTRSSRNGSSVGAVYLNPIKQEVRIAQSRHQSGDDFRTTLIHAADVNAHGDRHTETGADVAAHGPPPLVPNEVGVASTTHVARRHLIEIVSQKISAK